MRDRSLGEPTLIRHRPNGRARLSAGIARLPATAQPLQCRRDREPRVCRRYGHKPTFRSNPDETAVPRHIVVALRKSFKSSLRRRLPRWAPHASRSRLRPGREQTLMTHRIAVMPGDGIGKEVMPEGQRVLEAVAKQFGIDLAFTHFDWSCDYY